VKVPVKGPGENALDLVGTHDLAVEDGSVRRRQHLKINIVPLPASICQGQAQGILLREVHGPLELLTLAGQIHSCDEILAGYGDRALPVTGD
jgi:hypothetical protein